MKNPLSAQIWLSLNGCTMAVVIIPVRQHYAVPMNVFCHNSIPSMITYMLSRWIIPTTKPVRIYMI